MVTPLPPVKAVKKEHRQAAAMALPTAHLARSPPPAAAREDEAGQGEQGQGRQRGVDGNLVVAEWHRRERLAILPEQHQRQAAEHGEDRRAGEQRCQQQGEHRPERKRRPVEGPGEAEARRRQHGTDQRAG
jgi:hypothetical protein